MVITWGLMLKIFTGQVGEEEQKALEEAGKIATEATINIRTVADLGREETFAQKFEHNTARVGETHVKIYIFG